MQVTKETTLKSLFETNKPPDSLIAEKFYVVDGLKFSVLQSEEHNRRGRMTIHPMEKGVQVSDHFIQEPETVNARFEQTNTMYSGNNPFEGNTTQDLLDLGAYGNNWADAYCRQVWADLTKMYDTRKVFNLITFHQTYENVMIVSISGIHRAPYKGALQFNVAFQKINFIEIQAVVRTQANVSNKTMADKQDAGTQKPYSFGSETSLANLPIFAK